MWWCVLHRQAALTFSSQNSIWLASRLFKDQVYYIRTKSQNKLFVMVSGFSLSKTDLEKITHFRCGSCWCLGSIQVVKCPKCIPSWHMLHLLMLLSCRCGTRPVRRGSAVLLTRTTETLRVNMPPSLYYKSFKAVSHVGPCITVIFTVGLRCSWAWHKVK